MKNMIEKGEINFRVNEEILTEAPTGGVRIMTSEYNL